VFFDGVFLTLSECIDREGRRLVVHIEGIVHEGSDEVILWKSSRVKLRSTCEFLKMKLNGNKASNSFETVCRQCSEGSQYPDGGSSLHFSKDFHGV